MESKPRFRPNELVIVTNNNSILRHHFKTGEIVRILKTLKRHEECYRYRCISERSLISQIVEETCLMPRTEMTQTLYGE